MQSSHNDMEITRRTFNKIANRLLLLAVVGSAPLSMTGCNVIQDLIDFIPWIIRAINSIKNILGVFMPPGAGVIVGIIIGVLADLQAAAVEYQSDPLPADKATLLAKIETFLRDIVEHFQSFLDALGSAGVIASVVIGIIQVVLSTIGWFAGQLASKTGRLNVLPMPRSMRAGNQMIFVVAQKRSIKQFKDEFNKVVYYNGHAEQQMW